MNNFAHPTRKTYLITGAAGFIGSNIAQSLNSNGHNVIICDRFRSGSKWRNLQAVLISDVIPPENISEWIKLEGKNLDGIIHMGAISATTETDVDKIIINNFKLSSDLWRSACIHGLPFIYASSAATYGNGDKGFLDNESASAQAQLRPLNPYGWSKLIFDRYIISEKDKKNCTPPQWVGLKFFNVYGPNEHHKGEMRSVINKMFPKVYNNEVISLFRSHKAEYIDGGQLRDFIYVKDCLKVINWFLNNNQISGIFNVGTGKPRSFNDLIAAVGRVLNKKPKIEYVDMPSQIRNSYQYYTKAEMDKISQCGYVEAFHSLEDGVEDYIICDLLPNIQ